MTANAHPPTRMGRTNETHFHTKSWSDNFLCDVCGKARRMNLNYLGSRRGLYCDGDNTSVQVVTPGPTVWSRAAGIPTRLSNLPYRNR